MRAEERTIKVVVNGEPRAATVEVRTLLSDFLRAELGLTGTHVGCEHGVCGACTVLVNGVAVRSCLMLAVQVQGAEVATVESLAPDGQMNALQEAMQTCHGLQCGFCTPGILMSLTAAEQDGQQAETVIDDVLGGHLCRCTGYQNIRAAIRLCWQQGETDDE